MVVVGGPGGGFFTIAGAAAGAAPVAVVAGTAITAGSNQPEKPDDPEKPPTSVPDEQPSSAPQSSRPVTSSAPTSTEGPTSTEAPTSTSSAVPGGSPAPHVAYPRDDATAQDKKDFLALVDKEIGKGHSCSLQFAANMTTAQRDALAKNPLVGGVEPDQQYQNNVGASVLIADRDLDDEVHEKWWMESLDKLGRIRKRAVVKQDKAPTELVMFSQPPLVDLETLASYTYDESAGEEITVYVLDEGYCTKNSAQMDTQEYTGMAIKPRWIFGGAQAETSVEEDVDPGGHGSCAGSKVNGPKYGVAKKASLVVVKAGTSSVDTNDALDKILEDVRAKKLQGKASVNFSRCIEAPSAFNQKMIAHYVKELIREDVIFIVAAGNDDREEVLDGKEKAADVNSWPALMAGDGVPVINVGAVDNAGKNASFSQGGPLVHVMAPGVQVQCAANSYFYGTQKKDGTSFAAPAVAGLAAYLLAVGEHPELYQIGKVAENMKKLLMDMACLSALSRRWSGRLQRPGRGLLSSKERKVQKTGSRRRGLFRRLVDFDNRTDTDLGAAQATGDDQQPTRGDDRSAAAPSASASTEIDAGTTACFPTGDFSTTAGTTYGFSFDVDPNMVVSIQTCTDEGYFQAKGPWTGTFLATADSSVSICGTGASGALSFKVTEEPSQPIKAPAGKEVFKLDEKATAGATSCFPTSGLDIQEGNYGFSYTTSDGVEIQIGDDSSGPKYYTGNKASGAGLMYIDFSGGQHLYLCDEQRWLGCAFVVDHDAVM
ncbi:Subtilisin-like protease 2 [Colletotrichum spinosum]|uniref:Subtilisin-like protease 2 n=1 Tax=Colletotrichum spinosum TaxID=1347390 RepID=A0A4R8Q9F8_9PEZI|nr:Subtilisin-like protease 2 [Colletotrichum spinosum]